jgi:hypothetical protein
MNSANDQDLAIDVEMMSQGVPEMRMITLKLIV